MAQGSLGAERTVTARAVSLGMLACILLNLVMAYNDFHLRNSLLIGNYFPMASIGFMLVAIFAINTCARGIFKLKGLNGGEMLLIWGMIGVAGGIGSAGLMRYLPSWLVQPAYYTTAGNDYATYILQYLPDWMVLGKDPEDAAVIWFMEGMPQGASVPWGRWIGPLAAWCLLALCLFAIVFSLTALLFRQWVDRERLVFPLVHLPVELAKAPGDGRLLNDFLRNRLVWIGAIPPMLILGFNGLQGYISGLPQIPLRWSTWGLFPDRPWSEFNLQHAELYFSVIGLTFLLTAQMAFSLWFFFFIYRLSFVYVAWLGASSGYWSAWNQKVSYFEVAGAVLVLGGFILWTARGALMEWWRRAKAGRDDPDREPLPPRVALLLLSAGGVGFIAWLIYAGAQWWAVLLAALLFLSVMLVLTRLVAEAGLLFVQTEMVPYNILVGLFPAGWLSGITVNVFMLQKAIYMHDLRELLMPYLVNGLKACDMVRASARKVLYVFAATVLVAILVSAYGRIITYYKYGGVNLDEWCNVSSHNFWLGGAATHMKNPPNYDYARVGETPVMPANVAHVLTGGGIAAALLALRARFIWWPLHPFGLLLVGGYAMNKLWFSIFLGWAAKAGVMTFGGAHVYRRMLPLFLGLVLGECMIAILFIMLSLVTGVQTPEMLPR